MPITQNDYEEAAYELNVEVAAIKAVDEIESAGSGFFDNGEPKIFTSNY